LAATAKQINSPYSVHLIGGPCCVAALACTTATSRPCK
jgi:hypothetical protein